MYKKFVKSGSKRSSGVSFNRTGNVFNTIGDKIHRALLYGEDIGLSMSVDYDDENATEVDVTTSPNHDFFDIAEKFGVMVDEQTTPVPKDTE